MPTTLLPSPPTVIHVPHRHWHNIDDGATTPPLNDECTCRAGHLMHVEIVRDTAILMLQDLTIEPSLLVDAMVELISLFQLTTCEHGRPCVYEPEIQNLAAATLSAVTALPADPDSSNSSRSESPSRS